jgi:hypothetical protein
MKIKHIQVTYIISCLFLYDYVCVLYSDGVHCQCQSERHCKKQKKSSQKDESSSLPSLNKTDNYEAYICTLIPRHIFQFIRNVYTHQFFFIEFIECDGLHLVDAWLQHQQRLFLQNTCIQKYVFFYLVFMVFYSSYQHKT